MFSEVEHEEKTTETSEESAKKARKSSTKSETEIQKPKQENDSSVIELPEAKHWAKAGNIVGIAYSGVYTRDDTASVDILIIGNTVVSTIESVVAELEKEKNKELRYAVIEPSEWKYRRQVRDKFWLQFMAAKKQIVLDRAEVFKK
jgi:hypothetical protein